MLFIAQVLRQCESAVDRVGSRSGVFPHLPEYHGNIPQKSGLFHFIVEFPSLSGTLADTGKDRVRTEALINIVDQLLDQDSLSNTGTA